MLLVMMVVGSSCRSVVMVKLLMNGFGCVEKAMGVVSKLSLMALVVPFQKRWWM